MTAAVSLSGVALVASAVASTYLHYVAFPMILSLAMTLTLIWWSEFRFATRYLMCFAGLGAAIVIFSLPSVAIAILQRNSPSIAWMSPPSLTKFLGLVTGAPSWNGAPEPVLGGFILLSIGSTLGWGGLLLYGTRRYRRSSAALVYLLPVCGFLVLAALSLVQTFFFMRTMIWLSIPIVLGVGGATAAIPNSAVRGAVIGTLVLLALPYTAGYFLYSEKEPWKIIVPRYAATIEPDDLLVLGNDTPAVAFMYYGGAGVISQMRRWPANLSAADKLDQIALGIRPVSQSELSAAASNVWFLSRECASPALSGQAHFDLLYPWCKEPAPDGPGLVMNFIHWLKSVFW